MGRKVAIPLWLLVVAVGVTAVAAGVGGIGAGLALGGLARSGQLAAGGGPKKFLEAPVDRKAFEAAVMGRASRDVADMLGPPAQVLSDPDIGTGWVYRVEPSPDGKTWKANVILTIRGDHVAKVGW
jgi:hypothetical protein